MTNGGCAHSGFFTSSEGIFHLQSMAVLAQFVMIFSLTIDLHRFHIFGS